MRYKTLMAAALLVPLVACDRSPPKKKIVYTEFDSENLGKQASKPVTKPKVSSPVDVVKAWLKAAENGDAAAAYALGTPAFAERERTWKKSFSTAIFKNKFKLIEHEMREPEVDGDTAKVSVRATFKLPNGEEDGEGLRFELGKSDGVWRIVALK